MAEKSNNDEEKKNPSISDLADHERDNIRTMARNNSRRPRKLSAKGRYLVIPKESVASMVEQSDTGGTGIALDGLDRLSEDVTYRLYELIGNLKTAAAHSGGFVTADILNEVLGTSFVPPILGKRELRYQPLGDGEHVIEEDPDILILNEIVTDLKIEDMGRFAMREIPYVLSEDVGTVQSFYTNTSRVMLSGTKAQFQYAVFKLKTSVKYDPVLPHFLTLAVLILDQYSNDYANKKPAASIQRSRLLVRRVLVMVEAIANNREYTELSNLKVQIHHLVHQLLRILLSKIPLAGKNIKSKQISNKKTKLLKKTGTSLIKTEVEVIIKNKTNNGQKAINIKMDEDDVKYPPTKTDVPESDVQDNKTEEIVESIEEITSRENIICNVLNAVTRRWQYANILVLNLVKKAFFKGNTNIVDDEGLILALKMLTCGGILGHARFWTAVTSRTFKSLSPDTTELLIKTAVKFYRYFVFFKDNDFIDKWIYEVLGDAILPLRSGQLEYQEEPERSLYEPEVVQREKPYKFISVALNKYKNKRSDYFNPYNDVAGYPLKININVKEYVQRENKIKKRFQFEPLYYNNERTNNHYLIRRQLWNYTSYRNTYKYNLQAFHL